MGLALLCAAVRMGVGLGGAGGRAQVTMALPQEREVTAYNTSTLNPAKIQKKYFCCSP